VSIYSSFHLDFNIEVDHDENILPVAVNQYEETIGELFRDFIYDIEGIKLRGMIVNGLRVD